MRHHGTRCDLQKVVVKPHSHRWGQNVPGGQLKRLQPVVSDGAVRIHWPHIRMERLRIGDQGSTPFVLRPAVVRVEALVIAFRDG